MNDFSIVFEIDAGEGRSVRLEDFEKELKALTDTLLSADNFAAPGVRLTEYFIKDLHHSTPTVVLEARPVRPDADYRNAVLTTLFDGVNHLSQSGRLPAGFTAETIERLRDLSAPIGEGVKAATLKWGHRTAVVSVDLKDKLKKIRVSDDTEDGEIDGLLEQISIHGKPTFRIYPVVGPEAVTCEYATARTEEVKAALGKYVYVSGKLRYRRGAKFPYRVRVEEMHVLDEAGQPSLIEIKGIAPDATGEESTEEFLRRLRDGW
ncbi:MAG: hypothetical protein U1E49_01440 [Hyphomicrobiaceae bacterium]